MYIVIFWKKCLDKHKCAIYLNFAMSENHIDESLLFIYFNANQNTLTSNYGNLNVPPNKFLNYINWLDNICTDNFPTILIGKKIKILIDNVPFKYSYFNFTGNYNMG